MGGNQAVIEKGSCGMTKDVGRKQRVLITGGAGFIGSHLAEALLAQGATVMVIDDLSTGSLDNIAHLAGNDRFHFVRESITHAGVLDRLIAASDVVYHMAAVVGVELILRDPVHVIETNVLGSHAVLEAAARYRTPVILASTSEVYGKSPHVPFGEDDDRVMGATSKSRWSYATSKAVDEFLALAYRQKFGLPVIICRFFNTVGPRQTGQYGMVVPRFVRQVLNREPITIYGDGRQSRCFCNVRDVVRAIIDLMQSPAAIGEIFNVGSTEEITILGLAQAVVREVHGREAVEGADYIFIPYEEAYEPGFEDMARRVPDTGKIRRVIGWEPEIALEETLRQVAEHLAG